MIRNDLFTHIVRFNWLPASYIDASWLSPWLTPGLLETLRANPDSARTLNEFLLEEQELLAEVPADAFSSPAIQLLLLPAECIHRIVLYLGLTLGNHRIKQIICGKKQREVREEIGEDAFQFALKRAQFMVGSLGNSLRMDAMAEPARKGLCAEVVGTGLMLFAVATEHLARPAQRRILLKFHTGDAESIKRYWQAGLRTYIKDADKLAEVYGQINGLVFKVAQELYPRWQPVSA